MEQIKYLFIQLEVDGGKNADVCATVAHEICTHQRNKKEIHKKNRFYNVIRYITHLVACTLFQNGLKL